MVIVKLRARVEVRDRGCEPRGRVRDSGKDLWLKLGLWW